MWNLDYIIIIILIIHEFCCYLGGHFLCFVILLILLILLFFNFSTALFYFVLKGCREIGCFFGESLNREHSMLVLLSSLCVVLDETRH